MAKVSKVLIALEQGRLSDFKGMSLDQIEIDPNGNIIIIIINIIIIVNINSTVQLASLFYQCYNGHD